MEPKVKLRLPKTPIQIDQNNPTMIERALDIYNKILLFHLAGQELAIVPKIGKFSERQLNQGTHGIMLEKCIQGK